VPAACPCHHRQQGQAALCHRREHAVSADSVESVLPVDLQGDTLVRLARRILLYDMHGELFRIWNNIGSTVIYTFYTVILKVEPDMHHIFCANCLAFVETSLRAVHESHFGVVASFASFNVSQCVLIRKFCSLFHFVVQN
jgi:hypothetical protein